MSSDDLDAVLAAYADHGHEWAEALQEVRENIWHGCGLDFETWVGVLQDSDNDVCLKLCLDYGEMHVRKVDACLYERVRIGPQGDVREPERIGEWDFSNCLDTWLVKPILYEETAFATLATV